MTKFVQYMQGEKSYRNVSCKFHEIIKKGFLAVNKEKYCLFSLWINTRYPEALHDFRLDKLYQNITASVTSFVIHIIRKTVFYNQVKQN